MWDLTVDLANRPGTIADVGEALGAAGINIHGGCGFPCGGTGVMHLLVDDAEVCRHVLTGAGLTPGDARPVLTVKLQDRVGEMGDYARRLADAGINIDLIYLTVDGRLVLGVDDLEMANRLLF